MVQVEVDDYRDYDKALAALAEAHNILEKSPAPDDIYHTAITELRTRMTLIKAYLHAVEYVTMVAYTEWSRKKCTKLNAP